MKEKPFFIKEIVKYVIKDLTTGEKGKKNRIFSFWEQVAGEEINKHTKPYAFNSKKLFVRVDDSTWAFELSHKYKQSLLKRLQNEFGQEEIKDIFFRVGDL